MQYAVKLISQIALTQHRQIPACFPKLMRVLRSFPKLGRRLSYRNNLWQFSSEVENLFPWH